MSGRAIDVSALSAAIGKLLGEELAGYRADVPVTEQLKSLELVRLVAVLERRFSVRIPNIEIEEANLRSPETLAALIARRLAAIDDNKS